MSCQIPTTKRKADSSQSGSQKKRNNSHEEAPQHQDVRVPTRGDYTVGWVCALSVELAAAQVMLDQEHGGLGVAEGDTNSYVLGRIAAHHVVLTCLPQGTVGTNAAATVATNMTRSFPQLRFILLVGVGAGAPDPDNTDVDSDIRLGDVVVSKPDIKTGGVIQYDFGKTLQSSGPQNGKTLNKPPPILRAAVARLEAFHLTRGSAINEILQEVYQSYPRIKKKFQYPGGAQDSLFRAEYEHVAGQADCRLCQSQQVVSREHRDDSTPAVHYGLIASANQVMRDALTREKRRRDLGVICFEMEAAGMMDDCPCLVVRGICDYADSHKNKQWQPYAALTAAAYAKELLQSMEASSVHNESVVQLVDILKEQVEATREHVEVAREHHQKQDVRYQDDKHQACHRVFDTSDYERHKNVNLNAVSGTCRWVLDHYKYGEWLRSIDNNLLWISADPGCGKSVLSKSLVDYWLCSKGSATPETTETVEAAEVLSVSSHSPAVCYFFFKDNEEQSSLATALCALLHQLLSQQPDLISHAMPAYQKYKEGGLTTKIDELWRILESIGRDVNTRPTICVLDALDECRDGDRKSLVDLLCESHRRSTCARLKWLVTSRPHNDIQAYFGNLPPNMSSIRLRGEDENDQIRKEIDLVIEARMLELRARHKLSEIKVMEITELLQGMQNRTYLWLHLVMDDIEKTLRAELITDQAEISSLPSTVDAAYDKVLRRIADGKEKQYAKKILTIVVGAQRPLSLQEMAFALDIAISSKPPKSLADFKVDSSDIGYKIRHLCGLFVFINHDRLHLIHQTAKEFLLSTGDGLLSKSNTWKHCLRPLDVQMEMARVCVFFLCLSDFDTARRETRPLSQRGDKVEDGAQSFFSFASEHWADHTRAVQADLDEQIQFQIDTLYDTKSERFTRWTSMMWNASEYWLEKFEMMPVHLASFFGHHLVLCRLLEISLDTVNSRDATDRTAMIWAAERGYEKVVQILIDAGADVNTQGGRYRDSALYIASQRGHEKVVEILIDAGADVNTGGLYGSALFAASQRGHERVAQILVDAGADVNTRLGYYADALYIAAQRGHDKVIQILVDAGADVNARGAQDTQGRYYYGSALYTASQRGHGKAVQILVDAGADVNAQDEYGSALYIASERGHEEVVQILVDAGADVNTRDGRYNDSSLYIAAQRGRNKVVQILLDAGADVNTLGGYYNIILSAASERGHEKVVQILLDAGADVNARGGPYYNSALSAASRHGHEKVVQLLRNYGAIDTRLYFEERPQSRHHEDHITQGMDPCFDQISLD